MRAPFGRGLDAGAGAGRPDPQIEPGVRRPVHLAAAVLRLYPLAALGSPPGWVLDGFRVLLHLDRFRWIRSLLEIPARAVPVELPRRPEQPQELEAKLFLLRSDRRRGGGLALLLHLRVIP